MKCCEHKLEEERVLFQLGLVNECLQSEAPEKTPGNATVRVSSQICVSVCVSERKKRKGYSHLS